MEKEQVVENTRQSSASSNDVGERSPVLEDPKWQPGFWNRFPWIGFGALFMVLVCAAASVIVLVTSNHQSVTKWPKDVAPNVLLNVFSQVENICFIVAIGKTVVRQLDSANTNSQQVMALRLLGGARRSKVPRSTICTARGRSARASKR